MELIRTDHNDRHGPLIRMKLIPHRHFGMPGTVQKHMLVYIAVIAILLTVLFYLSRNALVMTETELKLMAAAAIIGLRRIPKNGNKMPAATGTPIEL